MTGREASPNKGLVTTEAEAETEGPPQPTDPPLLRVITPGATDEEVAALVAVVSALAAAGRPAPEAPPSAWSAHTHKVRTSYHHGPGAWRASGLPR